LASLVPAKPAVAYFSDFIARGCDECDNAQQ